MELFSKDAEKRKDICDSCEEKTTLLGIDKCGVCHCVIQFKVRDANTNCPINKW